MKYSLIGADRGIGAESEALNVPLYKRVLDIICIILAFPVLLPMMCVIAVIIKSVSPGPVFFKQERVGLRGRRFMLFKFRTMRVGAEVARHADHLERLIDSNAPLTKLDRVGDPRLIPGGAMLRAMGLDELPQLINVFRGEMSLVGPRPCTPYEYKYFLPWQRQRFETLPGLTGLWQVSGKNKTTFSDMVNLDIHYAKSRCLLMDLRIMFRTVFALVSQVNELKESSHSARQKLESQLKPRCCDAEVING